MDQYEFDIEKHMTLSKLDQENLKELERCKKFEWFVEVHKLTVGQSFGELALLGQEKHRAATIHTLSDCYFATIARDDYQRALKRIENKQIEDRVEFFN